MPATPARKIHTKVQTDKFTDKPNLVLEAVDELVDFVDVTLGPKIRHILVDFGFKTELMDDGVSIVEEFELEDEFKDAVVRYVQEAARKTDDNAGDGTTTTMVILRKLLRLIVTSNRKYPEIRAELDKAVASAVLQLKQNSVKVESLDDLLKVAKTSMNDAEAAGVVAEVVWKTGAKGAITITDHAGRGVIYERVEGFIIGRGFIARGMINDKEKQVFAAPNKNFSGPVAIAVVEELISTQEHIVPILQACEEKQVKNLAIFCPNLIGEAMGIVALNQMRGAFNVVAVQLPGQGEKTKDFVQDLCTVTGAKTPVGVIKADDLGIADAVKASVDDTTIIGGKGDVGLINAAIEDLRRKSEESKEDYEKEYFHQRQARLMGGIVILKVGGVTETEVRLRLKKVEDAVNACKCALEEGVSPGAGLALMRIASGSDLLDEALSEVNTVVTRNAECEDLDVDLSKPREGMNVLTREVGDFLDVGVADATKVLRTAVENAVSIATILFSTDGIITSKRQSE